MGQCFSHAPVEKTGAKTEKATTAQRIAKVALPVVPNAPPTATAPLSVTLKSGGGLAINIGDDRQTPSHQVAAVCAAIRSGDGCRSSVCSANLHPHPHTAPGASALTSTRSVRASFAEGRAAAAITSATYSTASGATGASAATAATAAAASASAAEALSAAGAAGLGASVEEDVIPRSDGFVGGDLQPRLLVELPELEDEDEEEEVGSPCVVDIREVSRFDRTPKSMDSIAAGRRSEAWCDVRSSRSRSRRGGGEGSVDGGGKARSLADVLGSAKSEGGKGDDIGDGDSCGDDAFVTAVDADLYLLGQVRGGEGGDEDEGDDSDEEQPGYSASSVFRTPCQSFAGEELHGDEDAGTDTESSRMRAKAAQQQQLSTWPQCEDSGEDGGMSAAAAAAVEASPEQGSRRWSEDSGRWVASSRLGPDGHHKRSATGLRCQNSGSRDHHNNSHNEEASSSSSAHRISAVLPRPGSANELLRRATANRVRAAAVGAAAAVTGGALSHEGSTHGSISIVAGRLSCSSRAGDNGSGSGGALDGASVRRRQGECSGEVEAEARAGGSSRVLRSQASSRIGELEHEGVEYGEAGSEFGGSGACSSASGGSRPPSARSSTAVTLSRLREEAAARNAAAQAAVGATAAKPRLEYEPVQSLRRHKTAFIGGDRVTAGQVAPIGEPNSAARASASGAATASTEGALPLLDVEAAATAKAGAPAQKPHHRHYFGSPQKEPQTGTAAAAAAQAGASSNPAMACLRQKAASERIPTPRKPNSNASAEGGGSGGGWELDPPQCHPHGVPSRFPDHLLHSYLRQPQQGQQQQQQQPPPHVPASTSQPGSEPTHARQSGSHAHLKKQDHFHVRIGRESAEEPRSGGLGACTSEAGVRLEQERTRLPPGAPRVPHTAEAVARRNTVSGLHSNADASSSRYESAIGSCSVGGGSSISTGGGLHDSPLWLYPSSKSLKTLSLCASAPRVRTSSLSKIAAPPDKPVPSSKVQAFAETSTDPRVTTSTLSAAVAPSTGGGLLACGVAESTASWPMSRPSVTPEFRQRWSDTNVVSSKSVGAGSSSSSHNARAYRGSDTNPGRAISIVVNGPGAPPLCSPDEGGDDAGAMSLPTPPGAISDRVLEAWGARHTQHAPSPQQQQLQQQPKPPPTPQPQQHTSASSANCSPDTVIRRPTVHWLEPQPAIPPAPAPQGLLLASSSIDCHRSTAPTSSLRGPASSTSLFHNQLYDTDGDGDRGSGGKDGYRRSHRNAVYESEEGGELRSSSGAAVTPPAATRLPLTLSQRHRIRRRDDDDGGTSSSSSSRPPPPPPLPQQPADRTAWSTEQQLAAVDAAHLAASGLRGLAERRKQRQAQEQARVPAGPQEEPHRGGGGGSGQQQGMERLRASGSAVSSSVEGGSAGAGAAAAPGEAQQRTQELMSRVARLSPLLAAVLAAGD